MEKLKYKLPHLDSLIRNYSQYNRYIDEACDYRFKTLLYITIMNAVPSVQRVYVQHEVTFKCPGLLLFTRDFHSDDSKTIFVEKLETMLWKS